MQIKPILPLNMRLAFVGGRLTRVVSRAATTSCRMIGVNERGNRIGEDHPGAKLTDNDVDIILELRDEGWAYRRIAGKMDCSSRQVRRICNGTHRAQRASRYKRL